MKIAGIIGGVITAGFGLCLIVFPHLLNWLVGGAFILMGIIYILQWIKK
jgi:hypothetical protein